MTPTERPLVNEETVAEYLANNNDFFDKRPELLADLATPQPAGAVVSLADRQVAALRERLDRLTATAKDNERIFMRLQALILALMDVRDASGLDDALAHRLVRDFEIDNAVCFIRGGLSEQETTHLAGVPGEPPWSQLFDRAEPSGEACRAEQYRALFPAVEVDGPASVTLLPVCENAVLAIGSKDPRRFSPEMGDVFLLFLAAVLSRTLKRLNIA